MRARDSRVRSAGLQAHKKSRRPGPPIRDNTRALYAPSPSLTLALEARLRPLLADVHVSSGQWRLPTNGFLNTKWRINRYDTGESFSPHFDTGHVFTPGSRTLLSVIAYLNDDFEGGETTFFVGDAATPVRVRPRLGAALVFPHYGPLSPLHGTEPLRVTTRQKYIARTDVTFEASPPSLKQLLFETPASVRKTVLLLGVPGAGKSTQLEVLSRKRGWATLNFGRCVRELKDGTTPLAVELKAFHAGQPAVPTPATRWLPDSLSLRIFEGNLGPPSNELVLLDGYPRRRAQSTQLETDEWWLLCAAFLKVSPGVQRERLEHRAASDRTTAQLDVRMQDWERDTLPLVEHYRKRGLLEELDADQPVEALTAALERVIEARWFDEVCSRVPEAARAWLDGFAPTKVNLSKKYRVYRFSNGVEERYLKVVYEPASRNPSSYEGPVLSTVKDEGFPFETPVVRSYFGMGPEVNGVISERVPGITVKEALSRGLLEEGALVSQWAKALATIHAFVPRRPEKFLARSVEDLLSLARQRVVSHVIRPQAFSAKYGIEGSIDLEQELLEVEARCRALSFEQRRLCHGDPCAPNFIWSTQTQHISFGEHDVRALLDFRSPLRTLCVAELSLLQNSLSDRDPAREVTDPYKGIGRVRHERVDLKLSSVLNVQVHSYQSRSTRTPSGGADALDFEVGGVDHFDILLFRNPTFFSEPAFEKVSLSALAPAAAAAHNEQARGELFRAFLSRAPTGSELSDHLLPGVLTALLYRGISSSGGRLCVVRQALQRFLSGTVRQ